MPCKIHEIPLTNILSFYVPMNKSFKTNIINKDNHLFLRIIVGDLVELNEYEKSEKREMVKKDEEMFARMVDKDRAEIDLRAWFNRNFD